MKDTRSSARVVIIGLGVVGAAVADELTMRGFRAVTVVEQGPVYATGGSSSHAPGFVFQIAPGKAMSELAQRTVNKMDGAQASDGWISKRVGGIELATDEVRLHELHRRLGFAESWGVPAELISAEEIARLWPGIDTSTVLGGLHTPTDAVVKGVRAVEWQTSRAVENGAKVISRTRVGAVHTASGRVTGVQVHAAGAPADDPGEEIPADIVISCAGFWGPGLARDLLGFEVPMLPVEHGFGFSQPLSGQGWPSEPTEVAKPMLRHQSYGMYLREWGNRLAIGAYEHRPMPVADAEIAPVEEYLGGAAQPSVHPFTPQDFTPTWAEAERLMPSIRGGQPDPAKSFNGIFSFTPDGGPLMGPVPGVDGLWMAQAVWVTQSAGVGEVLADWIAYDDPGIDTHGLDLSRFDPAVVSQRWSREMGEESYDEVYDIVHPRADTLRLRGLRTSPFYEREVQFGAEFGSANGWERPLWYRANADRGTPMLGDQPLPKRDEWAAQYWDETVAIEAGALREGVGLVDMSSLPRITVSGPGATEFLNALLSRPVGKGVGSVVYALLMDETGGVLSDITVARFGEEDYHLGINGTLDTAWLQQNLEQRRDAGSDAGGEGAAGARSAITIQDVGSGQCGLGLWGPQARAVLGTLTDDDVSAEGFRFYRCRHIRVAGVPVMALRLSYIGELGWELYAPAEFGRHLWDQIFAAGADHGILPVGRRAFESMRLEKGFRLWGSDLSREHTPYEAGIDFALRGEQRERVDQILQDNGRWELKRKLCAVVLEDSSAVLLGHEPVYLAMGSGGGPASTSGEPGAEGGAGADTGGETGAGADARGNGPGSARIGYVTSADQGFATGLSIAYAWLPIEHSDVGQRLSIRYFDRFYEASVVSEPIFDPTGERMRA